MTDRRGVALAAVLYLAFVLVGIALRPIHAVDEARYLAVAWEMYVTGDWVVPQLNFAPYAHKPPLLFWLINLVWSVTGPSEAAARLVPPLLGLGAILATGQLARRLWPDRTGIGGTAALALAATPFFGLYATLVMFDAIMALWTMLGLWAVVEVDRRSSGRWWLLYALALGCGFLTKGPVALLYLLPAPLLWRLWGSRPAGRAWYLGLAAAVLGGVGIGLAWALPAASAGGQDYANAILWGQTAGRIVEAFDHARPIWWYLPLLPAALLPWLLVPALWRRVPAAWRERDRALQFLLCWVTPVFIGFSLISGKQAHYLVPLLPAIALVVARAGVGALGRWDRLGLIAFPAAVGAGLVAMSLLGDTVAGLIDDIQQVTIWPGLALLAGGAALAWRPSAGTAAAGTAALFIAVNIAGAEGPFRRFDLAPILQPLAGLAADRIAVAGGYDGQFGYVARLTQGVERISRGDLPAWLDAHPAGAALAMLRLDQLVGLPPPSVVQPFRSRNFVIWAPRRLAGGR